MHHPFDAGPFRRGQVAGHHRRADGVRLYRDVPDAAGVRANSQPCERGFVSGVYGNHTGADGRDVPEAAENKSLTARGTKGRFSNILAFCRLAKRVGRGVHVFFENTLKMALVGET